MLYKAQARKNPRTGVVKYYPAVVLSKEPLKLEAIISEIVDATGVTRPDVKAVIAALEQRIIAAMRESKSFRMGDLGSFRPTIEGNAGQDEAKKVSTADIKAVHVRFLPSGYMERKLKPGAEGMTFTKVSDDSDTTATTAADTTSAAAQSSTDADDTSSAGDAGELI